MRSRSRKLATLAIAFVAGVATSFALREPQAAESAKGGGCPGGCGPAPCCVILGSTWCGCWWGEVPEEFE